MRRAAGILTAVVLLGGLKLLPGCGSSLTGGSIPPGSSRVAGIAVRGDNASVPLAGARLRFEPVTSRQNGGLNIGGGDGDTDTDGDGNNGNGGGPVVPVDGIIPGTIELTSQADGSFASQAISPGEYALTVTPPDGSGLDVLPLDVDMPADDSYWMILAPPTLNLQTGGLSGIEVTPDPIDLIVGHSVQIDVRLVGGSPPTIVPTYLLRGGCGLVNEQGRFTAIRAGTGTLRVVVGPYSQTIPVTIRPVQ